MSGESEPAAPGSDPLGPKFVQKKVDEDWKRKAKEESTRLSGPSAGGSSKAGPAGAAGAAGAVRASPVLLEFLTSLATQAALHLRDQDLEQARFLIEIFQVLKDRTQGRLADEEQKLLDRCLYELQLQYVQIAKAASRGAKGGPPPGAPGLDPRGWEGA